MEGRGYRLFAIKRGNRIIASFNCDICVTYMRHNYAYCHFITTKNHRNLRISMVLETV